MRRVLQPVIFFVVFVTTCSAMSLLAAAPVSAAQASSLPALSTKGASIIRNKTPFHFYGVNRDSLEWGSANWGGCGGDGHFTDHDFDLIKSWNVTAVRLPLSQAAWLGRSCPAGAYMQSVDSAIAKANARGMYAIIDLHWSDVLGQSPCDAGCPTGQQMMPDTDSLVFWRSVAQRYAANPGVIFDLYNEPHDVSWSCWRNGGCTAYASPYASAGGWTPYTAVGMQQLYNAVRGTGAKNLVLVGGLDWAYDLSGVVNGFALSGNNIAYDTHVYTLYHSTTTDWDTHFGLVAGRYPMVSTEFGASDCSTTDTSRLLSYFDAPMGNALNRIGWTIWSWNNPGSCQQPSIIADWAGDPLTGQGQLIKQTLATKTG
jgi:aryl-phospho-beta-D-glucosidase BglC (GH1 family)